jgi:hypothetical protein
MKARPGGGGGQATEGQHQLIHTPNRYLRKGGRGEGQGFGSGFNQVSGSGSVFGIRIRIQEGKMTHESRKILEISCIEVLDVLL